MFIYGIVDMYICTLDRFTKTPFLENHISQTGFLVLWPIETDVRKYIFPNYASFSLNWNSGKNDMLSKILTGGVLLT